MTNVYANASIAGPTLTLPPPPRSADPAVDLYPKDDDTQKKMVQWCLGAFIAADDARRSHQDRWERYYRLYRSYVKKRKAGEWRSRVFYPVCFWVVETILPRLVGQLPKMLCQPFGPEDVWPARKMEQLLEWASEQSELYLEQVKAAKSALIYGTGVMKTRHRVDQRLVRKRQPVMVPYPVQTSQPVMDPFNPGQPLLDANGVPVTESVEQNLGSIDTGMTQDVLVPRVIYDGPAAEAVDIFNFWPAPEATEVDDARYVIHRVFRDMRYFLDRVAEGVYRMPDNMTPQELANVSDEPWAVRLREVERGGQNNDPTRRPVELLEFWTDDGRVLTLANRKAMVRAARNPFDHGEKPFVRVVDHLVPHEFWGIGEIEPLEGLQDLQNALVNQRVDNVRMTLQSMFAVNTRAIENLSDLNFRPGGIIRVNEDGLQPKDAIHRIDFGDVTQGSFEEAAATENFIEKVSGVTAYQLGTDSSSMNKTATGVSILQESGNTRFSLKTRLAELIGMRRLARHFGSIIQQFMTEPMVVRLLGPDGQYMFQTFDPASIQGGLDFAIETESTTQTESARKDQAMTLFQVLAPALPQAVPALAEDILRQFGVKDMVRYLGQYLTPPVLQDPTQQQPGLPQGTPPNQAAIPEQVAQQLPIPPGMEMAQPYSPGSPDQQLPSAMMAGAQGAPVMDPRAQLDSLRSLNQMRILGLIPQGGM